MGQFIQAPVRLVPEIDSAETAFCGVLKWNGWNIAQPAASAARRMRAEALRRRSQDPAGFDSAAFLPVFFGAIATFLRAKA